MKKAIIIPIMLGLFLSSCGTATKYASVTFDDAVYQKPGSNKYVVVDTRQDQELTQLREKTHVSEQAIINGKIVEPLYADEYGNVEVNLDEEKSYIILNPGESFEERLKKFDAPDFRITINMSSIWDLMNDPWGYYWSPYSWRVYGRMYGYHYYSPFNHPYYNPWSYGFYTNYFSIDPFIGMSSMWYSHFYQPWPVHFSPFYSGNNYWWYSNMYRNWHHQQYIDYERAGRGSRQYYSDRRDPQRGAIRTISGESNLNSSDNRRSTARVQQVRGENVYTGSESIYRRESRQEGLGTNIGNTRTSEEFQRRGNTEVNRTASTGTVRRPAGEVNRGTEVNRNQSSGTVRRTTGEVNRSGYEGTVRRTNTEVNRGNIEQNRNSNNSRSNQNVRPTQTNRGQTTGTVRQSSVSTRQSSGTTNTGRNSSEATQSRNYRPAAVQTQSSRSTSGNQPSRNPFTNYNSSNVGNSRSAVSTGSSSTGSSSNTSSGSSSGSSSTSSGGGSTYRR
ncbi:MAG: hypothetical protein CVT97_01970 [Bacteroidetes bacterium HGW-Bacteroidetes-14]|nr:MAG: hypothetical protein CVT97_01970 [Bacteroidetes bacterium HGW-Bacteroidetes-14]